MINKKSQAWFFLEQTVSTGSIVTFPEEEARHAAGARRLEQGSSLTLFNGDGLVSDASVISLSNRGRRVELEITSTKTAEPPAFEVHLASALPKGDRLSNML